MLRKTNRWLKSKAGLRTVAGGLAVLLFVAIVGQGLGWWSGLAAYLRGTAGGVRDYPLGVKLVSFTAVAKVGQVVLTWTTQNEPLLQGFNLYRAEHGSDVYAQLNPALVPSQVREAQGGATYEFVDESATTGKTYDYQLESVDAQDDRTLLGTVTAEVPSVRTGLPPIPPSGGQVSSSVVELVSFGAVASSHQVSLTWETQTEQGNQGFDLYRAERGSDAYIRLNLTLIPSQVPEGQAGASYEFVDAFITTGGTYEYRLESVDVQGSHSYSRTITVEVPLVRTTLPPIPLAGPSRAYLPLIESASVPTPSGYEPAYPAPSR